jgi:hypothetical protein
MATVTETKATKAPSVGATLSSHTLKLTEITVEAGITIRQSLKGNGFVDDEIVAKYRLSDNIDAFPPITVYLVDGVHLLIDGHHRLELFKREGRLEIIAMVKTATRQEAFLDAATANLNHGAQMTSKECKAACRRFLECTSPEITMADIAIRMGRSRQWVYDQKAMKDVEEAVPVKTMSKLTAFGINDSQKVAAAQAGPEMITPVLQVAAVSGWTVGETAEAAKKVSTDAEYMGKIRDAAKNGADLGKAKPEAKPEAKLSEAPKLKPFERYNHLITAGILLMQTSVPVLASEIPKAFLAAEYLKIKALREYLIQLEAKIKPQS